MLLSMLHGLALVGIVANAGLTTGQALANMGPAVALAWAVALASDYSWRSSFLASRAAAACWAGKE